MNETKLEAIRQEIDEKQRSADEKRDEILKQLQEKLRLHVNLVTGKGVPLRWNRSNCP